MQAVLEAANIVDVISGYTSLRKRGVTYSGLCPFHQEKTPSFTVSADKGLYYCFGCGEGGDLVRFVERMENLSFARGHRAAGRAVRRRRGVRRGGGRRSRAARTGTRRLLLLLDKAATFYQRFLWESQNGQAAREYLEKRGLGREVCGVFRVGLSPDEWRGLHRRATKEGFSDRELEDAGLLVRQAGKTYDRFRGRLMFPLVDHRGRVVGFGGRTLKDENPKYLNSPEGPLYQKGHLLYGLYQARRAIAEADEVVVVEGYTDVLGLAQAGVKNVVASMGTSLTDAQIGLMMRFTSNVTFMFDADRAGTEAMLRSGELARGHSLRPQVALLPAGKDPADVAVQGGQEEVSRVMAGKMSLLGFELRQALDRSDTATSDGRVRAFEEVRRIMDRAVSLKEREEEIPIVADRLRLSSDSVALSLRGPSGRRQRRRPGYRAGPTGAYAPGMTERLLGQRDGRRTGVPGGGGVPPGPRGDRSPGPHSRAFLRSQQPRGLPGSPGGVRASRRATKRRDRAGEAALAGLKAQGPRGFRGRPPVRAAGDGSRSGQVFRWRSSKSFTCGCRSSISSARSPPCAGALGEGGDVQEDQRRLFHLEQLLASVKANLTNLDPEEGRA